MNTEKTIILPGFLSLFLSLVLLAHITSLSGALVSGILYGFGYGTVYPLTN